MSEHGLANRRKEDDEDSHHHDQDDHYETHEGEGIRPHDSEESAQSRAHVPNH